jgi:hypothetical protein
MSPAAVLSWDAVRADSKTFQPIAAATPTPTTAAAVLMTCPALMS